MKLLALVLGLYLLLAFTLTALTYFTPHWIETIFHSDLDSNNGLLELVFTGSLVIMTSFVALAEAVYLLFVYWRSS